MCETICDCVCVRVCVRVNLFYCESFRLCGNIVGSSFLFSRVSVSFFFLHATKTGYEVLYDKKHQREHQRYLIT